MKKVLLSEHVLVDTCWPVAMRNLMGPGCLATSNTQDHRRRRKRILRVMRLDNLEAVLPEMRDSIQAELTSWASGSAVDIYHQAKLLTLRVACAVLLGYRDMPAGKLASLAQDLLDFGEGFFQLPIAVPFTKYYKVNEFKLPGQR